MFLIVFYKICQCLLYTSYCKHFKMTDSDSVMSVTTGTDQQDEFINDMSDAELFKLVQETL